MAKGIRSYGPGKFYTILDSYVFEVTLDDGADEEASYPQEGSGWYGLVWIDKGTRERVRAIMDEASDEPTEEENDLLNDSVAVIFFERSDGIVEANWFDTKKEADKAWVNVLTETEEEEEEEEDIEETADEEEEDEEEEEEEDEEDAFDLESEMEEGLVIHDARGSKYSVSLGGKSLGSYDDFDLALLHGARAMHAQNFFPNVFHVNDHGNVDLLAVTPEVKRGKVVSVEYTVERSWV